MHGGLIDFTGNGLALLCLAIFVVIYSLVVAEEKTHVPKSVPVMGGGVILWIIVAYLYLRAGSHYYEEALDHNLLEYGQLFLFLLVAMAYVDTMTERNVFSALREWLIRRNLTYRGAFWLTGAIAFPLSAMIDNLTTALVMGTVVITIGSGNRRFIVPGCINIVVAANAGGAWCAFGDITTLMVWQAGKVGFFEFFALFPSSVVNWLVPAIIMSFGIENTRPPSKAATAGADMVKRGGMAMVGLFAATIAVTVSGHALFHFPPVMGMILGLTALILYGKHLEHCEKRDHANGTRFSSDPMVREWQEREQPFNVMHRVQNAEWDTLFFFLGIMLSVGALATLGYMAFLSQWAYGSVGPTTTNVGVGVLSALVDNIPVMYAVILTDPAMSHWQWLLVTLTAGVGGSMLSIGSAAGVALMGKTGLYTFRSHLRYTPTVALGYAFSIGTHMAIGFGLGY